MIERAPAFDVIVGGNGDFSLSDFTGLVFDLTLPHLREGWMLIPPSIEGGIAAEQRCPDSDQALRNSIRREK